MQVIGRTAAWVTVTVMALVSTGAVVLLAQGFVEGRRLLQLVELPHRVLAIGLVVLAIAPWWALAAVLGQQQPRSVRSTQRPASPAEVSLDSPLEGSADHG